MSNKKSILEKIVEDNRKKIAQEVVQQENEIDQNTADKLAREIFDKIFDEELNKIISNNLY